MFHFIHRSEIFVTEDGVGLSVMPVLCVIEEDSNFCECLCCELYVYLGTHLFGTSVCKGEMKIS